jgi:hypothetical protein
MWYHAVVTCDKVRATAEEVLDERNNKHGK